MSEPSERDLLIKAFAEILTGLQVPYSIGPAILGTAGPAVKDAWDLIPQTGWLSVPEFERGIRAILD